MDRSIVFTLAAALAVGFLCVPAGLSQAPKPPGLPPPPGRPASPAINLRKAPSEVRPASLKRSSPNISKWPYVQRQFYLSARSGTEWLLRMNRRDGRFVYGLHPALKQTRNDDNFVHQAATVFTLARAANYFSDEKKTSVARQALLTLLLSTVKDEQNPLIRRPVLATADESPLAAAGWLLAAIHELPSPGADLLDKSDELCRFIRSQQSADGSFRDAAKKGSGAFCAQHPVGRSGKRLPTPFSLRQAMNAGPALFGLMRSMEHRQGPWKLTVARRALKHYQQWWRKHKNREIVPWHSAAYAEAFARSKDRAFAESVNEMTDWICTLQYTKLAPRHVAWVGAFKQSDDDRFSLTDPDVHSAAYMEGLAQACRVARATGDLPRFRKYREALEGCGRFLLNLQYTSANTQHFAEWYQPHLLGAFHASHRDGSLRIDYTQQAVNGLLGYLAHGATQ